MSEWKALNGRITLFPTGPQSIPSAADLYRAVWDTEPDAFQKQPNPLQPTVAQGRRKEMGATCLAHVTRVDFNLSPVLVPSQTGEPKISLIEDTSQLFSELKEIIKKISGGIKVSSVSRVALYLEFVTVRANVLEANKALTGVMPEQYRISVTDEEDFIFQVNRPRKSGKVEGLRMNFVTKWSVENVQVMVALSALAGGPPIPGAASWVNNFLTASVSFDYNNLADRPLTTEQQSQLLNECLGEASGTQKNIGLNVEGF
jgi:hypothetical protein